MLDALEQLIRTRQLIGRGSRVLCAVSGGADSVCLLHALYHLRPRLGFSLTAAHYDHNLRGEESHADARFVEQFVSLCCGPQRLADGSLLPPVSLISGSGDVAGYAREKGLGVEEAARELRYAFLRDAEQAGGCDLIATAHNADDNTETILFHLARGTGLRGLTGIPAVSGDLIRPLLTTSRREIEAYLQFYGLPHREDHTNRDDTYARNRLRHQVTPVLEELFPGVHPRIANTADLLRSDEDCLSSLAADLIRDCRTENGALSVPVSLLAQAHEAIASRAVRLLIARLNGGDQNCAAVHLRAVLSLCREGASPSGQADLPYGLTARREYGTLILSHRQAADRPSPVEALLPGETSFGSWQLCCTAGVCTGQRHTGTDFWLSREKVSSLTLRTRAEGDRLAPPGRPSKTVKKRLIDEKIPRQRRDLLPVLDCGGTVTAVALLGPDQSFVPKPGEAAWHMILKEN